MGTWEKPQEIYKHECKHLQMRDGEKTGEFWFCHRYNNPDSKLTLTFVRPGCCHDDENEIEVVSCPFCGYKI